MFTNISEVCAASIINMMIIALIMEAARTPGMLVNLYQSTWRYNREDSHLHTHLCENLKSYNIINSLQIGILYFICSQNWQASADQNQICMPSLGTDIL
jgi:hypothetical protein